MAKFVTVSPTSGDGNAVITATVAKHTGNASRTNKIVVTCDTDATKKATITVTQAAAGKIFTKTSANGSSAQDRTLTITIKGTANVSKLYAGLYNSVVYGGHHLLLPRIKTATCKINNAAVTANKNNNGIIVVEVADSITNAAQYTFEFVITCEISTNAYNTTLYGVVRDVLTNLGASITTEQLEDSIKTDVLTQLGTDAAMSATPTSSSPSATGGSVTINVTSNDTWKATVTE